MEQYLSVFSSSSAWISILMLTFMEVVLGVDNIIFVSIVANRLPKELQDQGRQIGLGLALGLRVILLFGITFIQQMTQPFTHFTIPFIDKEIGITGQGLILFAGGVFLLYKSVSEIHHKLEGDEEDYDSEHKKSNSLMQGVLQIALINLVFSFDSILTAVGMTSDLYLHDASGTITQDPLLVMALSVIFSMGIMIAFSGPVGRFINQHPTVQMLGLSFLILIGFLLIAEAGHSFHLMEGEIPKSYLYFAIVFSLGVEFLNIKMKKSNPVKLHSVSQEAEEDKVI